MTWVWNQTLRAVNCVLDGEADVLIEKYSEQVRTAINTADLKLAEELLVSIENEVQKEVVE
jgi:hypothetical protein